MNRHIRCTGILTALALVGAPTALTAAETVRLAYIDPLSGGFANVGNNGLAHLRFLADRLNEAEALPDGMTYEVVPFDNKVNASESLIALQRAIDQGIRIVVQGNGSSVAHALVDAISKHNRRNPGEEVIHLNYASIDPALTNESCSFWHFGFDAHVDIKVAAIAEHLANRPDVTDVYLINQDYSFGRAVAAAAEAFLPEARPDINIVGSDFHPLIKVKDFSPYVAKIQTAGTDAVVTGNWGNDMSLLIKAGREGGLEAEWFTFYVGLLGGVSAIGEAGVGKVKQISEWHANVPNAEMDEIVTSFKAQYPDFDWYYYRLGTMMDMLTQAINDTGSTDPEDIAFALEGMRVDTPIGEAWMRPEDHQLFQTLFLATLSNDVTHDVENSGIGFVTDERIELDDTILPTTCEMQRPS